MLVRGAGRVKDRVEEGRRRQHSDFAGVGEERIVEPLDDIVYKSLGVPSHVVGEFESDICGCQKIAFGENEL